MLKTFIPVLKVFVLRHRCAHSIRNVRTNIKNHVEQVESISNYFMKVADSYKGILKSVDSAAKVFEKAETELVDIYRGKWSTGVKSRMSDDIMMIRENKTYLNNLKNEIALMTQTAEKI